MFSVVIPLYNKENHIERTIRSVLNQTYVNFEILVINDGSTDNSKKIVESIKDNRIHLINKVNEGESSARNLGIKMATYNFIAFIDADDSWQPDFLFQISKLINDFPNAGIYTCNYMIKTQKGKYRVALKGKLFKNTIIIKDYFKTSLELPTVTSNTAVIPIEVFRNVGNFNVSIKIGPDLDMWYRIVKKYDVAYTPYIGAIYYHDAQNRVCNIKRNFNRVFFENIKINFNSRGISSKISELKYVNELAIKEVKEMLKINDSKYARKIIKELKEMNLFVRYNKFYYLLTYLPIIFFKISHKIQNTLGL